MLIVTGHIHVSPPDLPSFLSELNTLAVSTREREGNISYDAAADDPPSGRLLISERWADEAALNAHLLSPDTNAFVRRWAGRMRGDIRIYDASNERRLPGEPLANATTQSAATDATT
jgi:quinol monooxygenase YgiN